MTLLARDGDLNLRSVTFAGCFGWLHQGVPGSLGVVMCASWEYEAGATYQSWRVFGDRLAAAGLPTLRFDYPGCGDSLGEDDAPEALVAMTASIGAACVALREQAGVTEIALVGLRLGAALALSAARTLDIAAIAMIRPVVRGKRYLAEQRALSRIVQSRGALQVRRDADPGAIEVEGYRLSPESVDAIAAIDLSVLEGPAPRRVLIAGEPGSAQYDALRENLIGRGATVTMRDLAEVAGWAPEPVPLPPPLADCDAIAAWLSSEAAAQAASPAEPSAAQSSSLETSTFRETAIAFSAGRALTGILCRPVRSAPDLPARAVIFVNTGANSHAGAGRAAVFQARKLAELGVASLRMDLLGVGDSAWTPEGPLSAIHNAHRAVDVSQAIDALATDGFSDISLVGVCSGAFLAFQTALADPRVNRILLANPQFWLPPTPETLADPMKGAYGSTAGYIARAFSATAWRRLLRGEIAFSMMRGVAREITERLAQRAAAALQRATTRALRQPPSQSPLAAQLRRLALRGCAVRLLLSEGDPARESLAALLPGGDVAAVDDLMQIIAVEGADHAFVMRRTRLEFFAILGDFLSARNPRKAAPLGRAA